jgi:hypothetical protein
MALPFNLSIQLIGKIDGFGKVGISYYDICTFGILQVFSI